jgi:16S rRNA (cytidine1402-2'-O)-methyltransferase
MLREDAPAQPASLLPPGLYVVGTPIGNLEDISLRSIRVLKQADLIACEDTRHTQKLLDRQGISTQTISYHQHNETARAQELLTKLRQGARIALVTDAGMPGIADPGYRLIGLAIQHRIPVFPVPGPVAYVAALVASGLPTDKVRFHGFLPAKSGQRRRALEQIADSQATEIFYEAPHRMRECMRDVVEALGPDRPVVIAREITKLHEEFIRGRAMDVFGEVEARELKGEMTLLIGKSQGGTSAPPLTQGSLRKRYEQLIAEDKLDDKAALKRVAKEMGLSRSEAYRELQRGKS